MQHGLRSVRYITDCVSGPDPAKFVATVGRNVRLICDGPAGIDRGHVCVLDGMKSTGWVNGPGMAVMIERMRAVLSALLTDQSGATALEYGLILTIISLTVVSWATFVGTSVSNFFVDMANGM